MRALLIIGRKQGSDALELLNPTSSYQQSVAMSKDLITRIHNGDKTYAQVSIFDAEPQRVLRPRAMQPQSEPSKEQPQETPSKPAEQKQQKPEKKGNK